jgi:hypothetical protein
MRNSLEALIEEYFPPSADARAMQQGIKTRRVVSNSIVCADATEIVFGGCMNSKKLFGVWVGIILCLTTAGKILAQERQVPLDRDGKIMAITWQDEQQLHVFSDLPRFSEVRLFQTQDTLFVLEISYMQDAAETRERRQLNAVQVDSLRARVTRSLEENAPRMGLDQSGRPTFLTMSVINAVALYAPAITYVLQPSDVASGALTYMVGGIGGFFIPYMATSKTPLTSGQASLARLGFLQGALHVPALFAVLRGTDNWTETDTRVCIFSGVVGGLGGTLGGLAIAGKYGFSEGRSEVLGSFWTDALVIGTGLSYTAGLYDLDLDTRSAFALQLALSGAGLYAANELSTMQHFTAGDARVMAVPSYLGAGLAASILPFVDFSPKATVATLVAGYATGCVIGWNLVRDRDYPGSNATYTILGTIGGALVGGAIGIAAEDGRYLPLLMNLGGIAGFAIMARSNEAETRAKPRSAFLDKVDMDIRVHPEGIAQAAGLTPRLSPLLPFVTPAVTASMRW